WIPVSCWSLTLQNLPTDPHLPLDLPLSTNLLPLQTFHLLQILFHQRSFNLGHYHCFFSILHLLSSPLSVLFTRIIHEGRSKPEIFSNFTVFCPRGSWPSILSPFQAKEALPVDSLVLGFGYSNDLIFTFISVGSMHFCPTASHYIYGLFNLITTSYRPISCETLKKPNINIL
ncbi:unnamed protein product, partial [Brassica oleracea]